MFGGFKALICIAQGEGTKRRVKDDLSNRVWGVPRKPANISAETISIFQIVRKGGIKSGKCNLYKCDCGRAFWSIKERGVTDQSRGEMGLS